MTTKILYAEMQPCVIATCNCKEGEPFLMLFRFMDQTVRCGNCEKLYKLAPGISLQGTVQVALIEAVAERLMEAKLN